MGFLYDEKEWYGLCKDLGELLQPSSCRPHLDMQRTHFLKEFIGEMEGMFNLKKLYILVF